MKMPGRCQSTPRPAPKGLASTRLADYLRLPPDRPTLGREESLMGEATLTVPAEYIETLRGGVMAEVGFWHRAVEQDLTEIARRERPATRSAQDRAKATWAIISGRSGS